jgi:tRNA (uracil-5-)-methyltransferase TRM9
MENQQNAWDELAVPWEENRIDPVEEVIDFLQGKEGHILDLGCGSGRNFTRIIGTIHAIDFAQNMLNLAKKKANRMGLDVEFTQAEAQKIPYENNYFNAAIFIDSLHCIKGEDERKKAVKELFRLLKPGAKAMITVWSRNSDRIKNREKETEVPWSKDGKKIMRYYYIYEKTELENLFKSVGFEIISSNEDKKLILIVKKPRI